MKCLTCRSYGLLSPSKEAPSHIYSTVELSTIHSCKSIYYILRDRTYIPCVGALRPGFQHVDYVDDEA